MPTNLAWGNTTQIPDHASTGQIVSLQAGEALAFGEVVYFKSDKKVYKADANSITTMPVIGMANAIISAEAYGNIFLFGIARDDSWSWTIGAIAYGSSTAGGMTQTSPVATDDVIQALGVAFGSSELMFNPSPNYATHN